MVLLLCKALSTINNSYRKVSALKSNKSLTSVSPSNGFLASFSMKGIRKCNSVVSNLFSLTLKVIIGDFNNNQQTN